MLADDTLKAIEALSREAYMITEPVAKEGWSISQTDADRLHRIVLDIHLLAAYPDSDYSRNLTALLTVK